MARVELSFRGFTDRPRCRTSTSTMSQRGGSRTRTTRARGACAAVEHYPLSKRGAQTWCRPTFSGSSDRRYHWTSSLRAVCRVGLEPDLAGLKGPLPHRKPTARGGPTRIRTGICWSRAS